MHPATIALLDMGEGQRCHLGSSKTATEKNGQDGPVAQPFCGRANSGARSPLSAASAARFRMADILTMMEDEPSPRASTDTRHALTVAW